MGKNFYIDLFAGCGGLSLGLHNAKWQGVFAVEKNADAFSTLEHNLINKTSHFDWPAWLPKCNHDINDLLKNYKTEIKNLSGKVSLVVGGPPCQGFSMAGTRESDDIRNKLSNSYIKFISYVKPEMLFFENVHGFTVGFGEETNKGMPYSDYVKKRLEKLGYKVKYEIIDMSMFGIPQKRKRFILVGCLRKDPSEFFIRLHTNKEKFFKEKGIKTPVTVGEALSDITRENGETFSPDTIGFKTGLYGETESDYQKLMRNGSRLNVGAIVDSHRFVNHKLETIKLNQEMLKTCPRGKRIGASDDLVKGLKKRGVIVLDKDRECATITSNPDDFLHFNEPRILTVRECARIQSFPDDYEFKGKYTTGGKRRKLEVPRYTQVANAVPPLFAEQVGKAFKEMLEDE